MADETQATQQAAETQPETQPQPAAQPESGAQAAPEKRELVKLTLTTGQDVYYDGTGQPLDAEGKPLAEDPRPKEKPADGQPVQPEAQADGVPADDPVAAAKAEVEAANRRLRRAEYLSSQAGRTYLPAAGEAPQVEFERPALDAMPEESDSQTTEEYRQKLNDWVLQQIETHGTAHAEKRFNAHVEALQKQARQAQAAANADAERQRAIRTHQEAVTRADLTQEQYVQKLGELQRASVPPNWNHQQPATSLPFNYFGKVIEESLQQQASMNLPLDDYSTPADLMTLGLTDTPLMEKFSVAFGDGPAGQTVMTAIGQGPFAVERVKALVGTDAGQKLLARMKAVPPAPFDSPYFGRYVAQIQRLAAALDTQPAPPRAAPAQPAQQPAQQPAEEAPVVVADSPYATPAAAAPVTPEMRATQPPPSGEAPNMLTDPVGWERHVVEKMRRKAQVDKGYIPAYLQ